MLEIEKIMMVREAVALDSDREKITDAMNALSSTFKQMLFATREFMQAGKVPEMDLTELHAHMDTLREIAARFGVDFPATDTDMELREFVIKFGTEIIQN